MKKNYFISMLAGALMMVSTPASAQYITEAPAGGFDFSKGKDYVVIYSPAAQVTAMGSKILSNQNLDPAMEKNQFYYWVCDWSEDVKSQFTLYNIVDNTPNSWGGTSADSKINMTPLWWWGGGNFAPKNQAYDLSKVDNDHFLHIGFCDIGGENAMSKPQFVIGWNTAQNGQPANYNGFGIKVGVDEGKEVGDFVGIGTFSKQKTWYYIDIPIADLIDKEGDYAFSYSWGDNIMESIFTVNFGSSASEVKCSDYTYGAVDPDTKMKTVTINKVGNALAIDHVFFYKPAGGTGVSAIRKDNDVNAPAYNLNGQRVGNDYKGITIVNGKKVVVK